MRRNQLLLLAIAYYLGNPTEVDHPIDAYWHALGYPSWYEVKQALGKERSEVEARARSAYEKLMAKFGVSSMYEWPAIVALEPIEAGLSDEYKNHLKGWIESALRRLRSEDENKPRESA